MASLSRRALTKALTRKFGYEKSAGSRHDRFTLFMKGKRIATTYVSRGTNYRELGAPILTQIAHQVQVGDLSTLLDMVECTVSLDEYRRIVATS